MVILNNFLIEFTKQLLYCHKYHYGDIKLHILQLKILAESHTPSLNYVTK